VFSDQPRPVNRQLERVVNDPQETQCRCATLMLRKYQMRGTARVGYQFMLNMAAYNLARLPKLLAA